MSRLTPEELAEAATTARWTALARAGLTAKAVGTWDPKLARDPRLLVPIDVQALAVAPTAKVEAVPTATAIPAAPPGAAADEALPVPPAPFASPFARPPGVHIHWAMPDGLTRGDAGTAHAGKAPAGNPTRLPPLPDRWLVARLEHGSAVARSWVLEADRGDHHDLEGWTEPGPLPDGTATGAAGRRVIPRDRLTAVAGGDLAWAATYDAVLDRFAFHDRLDDVPKARLARLRLSYLVVGWWSDSALDPLHDCVSAGAYQDRARWLGWLAPEPDGLTDAALERMAEAARRKAVKLDSRPIGRTGPLAEVPGDGLAEVTLLQQSHLDERGVLSTALGPCMPRQALLHGAVLGVTLAGGLDPIPSGKDLELAVGPTGFAALSALLADGSDAARVSSERVLAAFASDLLATIDGPGGLAAVDEDRHAAAFTATGGGTRARPDRVAEGDPMLTERPLPKPSTRAEAAGKGGPAEKERRTLATKLVRRSRHTVEDEAGRKRFPEMVERSSTPRSFRDVPVPRPRSFLPADLAFVLRGAVRSWRHGGDGRFTPDGRLACRLSSKLVRGLRGLLDGEQLPEALRSLGSGAVPPEADLLLQELALTDPYRWREITGWIEGASKLGGPPVENRVKAELALRHRHARTRGQEPELGDEAADALRRASLYEGDDVSPVGVTRWAQPWVPLWCDFELELKVDDRPEEWVLGPIDLEPKEHGAGAAGLRVVAGRTLLASAAARAFAGRIRQWLSDEDARDQAGQGLASEGREAELSAAVAAAEGIDVLAGTFRGLRETLIGVDPIDASRMRIAADGTPLSKPVPVAVPLLLAGGSARIVRMRVVDAFGRWVDVPADRLAAAEIATALDHPNGAPFFLLPPRLQRPSRLLFRFIDPRTGDGETEVEARVDQQDADQAVSPVAGWLLPDHVDEALEFFDASGRPLGQVMHDDITGAVVWEGAPGRPGPVGGAPDPGTDAGARHVTRLAAGAVGADAAARNDPLGPPAESALSALLRAVDSTLWTVDPLGSMGTGAVAGLVGRPIAVVRAVLRLDVEDDLDQLAHTGAVTREARARAYADLAARVLTVRLGELTRSDDGLLAYAVDDDYSRLRLVAPEVRSAARVGGRMRGQLAVYGHGSQELPAFSPVRHPYVDGPTELGLHPGQTVRLTLLMTPGGKVHATSGVLPRKALALARDWFHDALVRLSPSFRVGPVLVEPGAIRLPMVTGLGDRQTFTRRDTPLTWRDDAIAAATQTAYLPEQPHELQEGWIRVVQVEEGRGGNAP